MNVLRSSCKLAPRKLAQAMTRTASRRRLTVCSATLAVVLGSVALPAATASAATFPGTCVMAVPQQVYPGGAVDQWGCDTSVPFEVWTAVGRLDTAYGWAYEIVNAGAYSDDDAADCLQADPGQVYPGGAIVQSGCSYDGSDLYQLWLIDPIGGGSSTWSIENYGALVNDDAADCLDADAQQATDGGAVIQWGCNTHDAYQLWRPEWPNSDQFILENLGTSGAVVQ
jgi:hypothetical protein